MSKARTARCITFIVEPTGPGDITYQPSLCHVNIGDPITFSSDYKFILNFGKASPIRDEVGPGVVQWSQAIGKQYVLESTIKAHLPTDAAGRPVLVYKYCVRLTDPTDPKKYWEDCYCPTIIVGELRGPGK